MPLHKVSLLLQKCAGLGSRLDTPTRAVRNALNILKTEKILQFWGKYSRRAQEVTNGYYPYTYLHTYCIR